ncbi:unnamed protein product [Meloidogyne enterolobii]|uniref:Uncharacterized protein n=1 Tax=Meloidogyne enterolobii TaxID=390850 RepID=A0ACB1A374_MELEN
MAPEVLLHTQKFFFISIEESNGKREDEQQQRALEDHITLPLHIFFCLEVH